MALLKGRDRLERPYRGPAEAWRPSRRANRGRAALPKGKEGSARVRRPPHMAGRGRESYSEGSEWSRGPPEGWEGLGGPGGNGRR